MKRKQKVKWTKDREATREEYEEIKPVFAWDNEDVLL